MLSLPNNFLAKVSDMKPILHLTSIVLVALSCHSASAQETLPMGDIGPWKQTFAEDFNIPAPRGTFTSNRYYLDKFDWYGDGVPDTAQQNMNDHVYSGYYPTDVLEVKNGMLIKHLHTAPVEGGREQGNAYISKAATLVPMDQPKATRSGWHYTLYGKYTIRFRADPVSGFKTAWLLWPQSEKWPRDGEIDFPEGNLDGSISAFMHRQEGTSGGDQDVFHTKTGYGEWNTASIEWMPGRINFILNGKLVGCSDERIPNTPMRWTVQTESCLGGCPSKNAKGKLEIDWMTMYAWQGTETPEKCPDDFNEYKQG
jgi:hypothetical protein